MGKYNISTETIPQDARKAINDKILYIINNNISEDTTGITAEDIANAYTGIGGLHGLSYNDYNSYYDYQKAKSEIENGQFFTPYQLVEWIYKVLKPTTNDLICDLTCGHGAFVNSCPNEYNFYGCEMEFNSYKVAKYLYPNAKFTNADMRGYDPKIKFDYIIGNPPYNLKWKIDNTSMLSELYYCIKSYNLLKPAGILCIIVPESFCKDNFSDGGMIKELENKYRYVCQVALDKNSFKHLGVVNYHTKLLILQKKSDYIENKEFSCELLNDSNPEKIYKTYIQPIMQQKESASRKIFLESIHSENTNEDSKFKNKVEKLLYDIKRNPKTELYYGHCKSYVLQYYTQKKPEEMNYDEWEIVRIKKDQVVKYLKDTLKKQNETKSKSDRIIKNNYCIEYNESKYDIYSLAETNDIPNEVSCKMVSKLINRKHRAYQNQARRYNDMIIDANIDKWLNEF